MQQISEAQVTVVTRRTTCAGTFSTRLFVWLDEKAGTVFFKLAKPGLMKAFEGKWTIQGCDPAKPLSALMDSRCVFVRGVFGMVLLMAPLVRAPASARVSGVETGQR